MTTIDLDTTSDRLLTEVERQQKYLDRLPENYVFCTSSEVLGQPGCGFSGVLASSGVDI